MPNHDLLQAKIKSQMAFKQLAHRFSQDTTQRAALRHNFARRVMVAKAKGKSKSIQKSKGKIRVLKGTVAQAAAPASKAPAPASPPSYVWDSVRKAGTAFAHQNIKAAAAKAADRAKARAKAQAALMLLDL